jgi:hypothetical protein
MATLIEGIPRHNPATLVHIADMFASLHKMAAELKIEKCCQAFTAQTAGEISRKLHRSDQYQPLLCISLARSPLLVELFHP